MTTGRFGSKYGSKVRKNVTAIESQYKFKKQVCPFCGKKSVKREAAGIFVCDNCGKKFAGAAYTTESISNKTIIKKLFNKNGELSTK